MSEGNLAVLRLEYKRSADDIKIVLPDDDEVKAFGVTQFHERKNILGYILPDFDPNQIDRICEAINQMQGRDDLHAEPIAQNEQYGVKITSDKNNNEFMATVLLKTIRGLSAPKNVKPEPLP